MDMSLLRIYFTIFQFVNLSKFTFYLITNVKWQAFLASSTERSRRLRSHITLNLIESTGLTDFKYAHQIHAFDINNRGLYIPFALVKTPLRKKSEKCKVKYIM